MRIAFLGAAHEVTGSCTVLYIGDKTVMVDCGLEQGPDIYENCALPMNPADIDAILLTHAHIDHSGKLPALVAGGFKGRIYTTLATARLAEIMLLDSAYIQENEASWRNKRAARSGDAPYSPLYTADDARRAIAAFSPLGYGEEREILDGVRIRFTDAGHLLGSASISVSATEDGREQTVAFSGDVGNRMRPLISDPKAPPHADFAVIESTYGDRTHGERIDYVKQMTRIIQSTLDRGGNLIIPAFAVGRTQELLYLIRIIKERGLIKGHDGFPVYVDSPLAVEATEIYKSAELRDYFDEEALSLLERGINPITFPALKLSVTADESIMINRDKTPKIILSASGMCEAGRIRHHLKHNLWRKDSTVLFVGYQSEGTLGRYILDGARRVKLFGEEIKVSAKIERLEGISSHADREMLLDWVTAFPKKPKTVFVNHGSDGVCDTFAAEIEERLAVRATAPYNGAEYDLTSGVCIERGNQTRIAKKSAATRRSAAKTGAFERLLGASRRLSAIVEAHRGAANKDIAKLTSQINSLADKWEK